MVYTTNLYELYKKLSSSNNFDVYNAHGMSALKSPTQHPALNTAFGSTSAHALASASHFFQTDPFCFLIDADKETEEQQLIQHGFKTQAALPEMVLDLTSYQAIEKPSTIDITPVNSQKDFIIWCSLTSELLHMPCAITQAYNQPIYELGPTNAVFYLGYTDHQPMATAMVHIGSESLCISSVTVKPEFQNKGIGTAMTHACLNSHLPKTVTQAVLIAYAPARNLYERMGFELTRYLRAFSSM